MSEQEERDAAKEAAPQPQSQEERLRLVNALDLHRKGQDPGAAMRLAGLNTIRERAIFMMRIRQKPLGEK